MNKKNTQITALTKAYDEIKTLERQLEQKHIECSKQTSQILTLVELVDAQKKLLAEIHKRDIYTRFKKWMKQETTYKLKFKK